MGFSKLTIYCWTLIKATKKAGETGWYLFALEKEDKIGKNNKIFTFLLTFYKLLIVHLRGTKVGKRMRDGWMLIRVGKRGGGLEWRMKYISYLGSDGYFPACRKVLSNDFLISFPTDIFPLNLNLSLRWNCKQLHLRSRNKT